MSILCKINLHSWEGCRCRRCGRTRDEAHAWDGCNCSRCGATRDESHAWNGCRCSRCYRTRDESHAWDGCKCSRCGKTRDESHSWDGCKCSKCGKTRDMGHSWSGRNCAKCGANNPAAEAEFERLKNRLRDYMSLSEAVSILGPPTRKLNYDQITDTVFLISWPIGFESRVEWRRPEGTFLAFMRVGETNLYRTKWVD